MIMKYSMAFRGTELGISRTGEMVEYRFGKFLSVKIPRDRLLEVAVDTFTMMPLKHKMEFLNQAFEILNDSLLTPELATWDEENPQMGEYEAKEEKIHA
ncbi:hypothetical protein GACE_1377 [Geoglobus acetivorans]|uniref:Uncharacterized protein n=2 Tax=Geoglobus acetivorans TaxID=565033 RepID=A0A0A7GF14_GEOAI|nr:hypothetical protein GACE_1377 [Geoglobus acetivorans]